jgi:hypothetical protein
MRRQRRLNQAAKPAECDLHIAKLTTSVAADNGFYCVRTVHASDLSCVVNFFDGEDNLSLTYGLIRDRVNQRALEATDVFREKQIKNCHEAWTGA